MTLPPMPLSDGCDDGITDWKERYRSDFGEETMLDRPDLTWEQRYKFRRRQLEAQAVENDLIALRKGFNPTEARVEALLDDFIDAVGNVGVDVSYFPDKALVIQARLAKRLVEVVHDSLNSVSI